MTSNNTSNNIMLQSIDGTKIFATAAGDPSNPPIVFVHGYTFSSLVFDDLFRDERLLSRYYMVTYDLRGHGRSGKPTTPEGYASNLFANDFATVVKQFNVKSPLYAGWSYGGTVMVDIFSHLPPKTISGVIGITAIPALELLVQNPIIADIIPQFADTTKLFEAGKEGFPYLALITTADKLLLHEEITKGLMPHFKNLEVYRIKGGGHTPFVENKEEFMKVFIPFADKVHMSRSV